VGRRVALALALAAVLFGCAREAPPNLLLVTLDTVRADHLGCYGYAQAATPNLDALSRTATRFAEATAAIPTTLGSHATMFTGQYPPQHGIRYNGMFQLSDKSVTVAEVLRDAGWVTGAVASAYPVATVTGIGQGFTTYEDLFAGPDADKRAPDEERHAADVTKLGLAWLDGAHDKRFFLWLHYYDAHYPYEPPFPYSSSFRGRLYDGEIAYVDAELGKLFAGLRERKLWDDLLVVVAGDHGEGLYEHDEKMHSHLVYQTTLHVPLLVKPPETSSGRVVTEPVSLVDVAPTILDYAGAPPLRGASGISLRPAARGEALARRTLYFESLAGSLVFGWSPLDGVRRGSLKLIHSPSPELYDLAADPGEKVNAYESEKEVAADLEADLGRKLDGWAHGETTVQTTEVPLDSRSMDRLISLGYAAGSLTKVREGAPNPRDKIHLEPITFEARSRMTSSDFAGALDSARAVLSEDPGNRYALHLATSAAGRVGKFEEAHRFAAELTKRYPEYVPGQVAEGDLYVHDKDFARAAEVFRRGLGVSPKAAPLRYRLALSLLSSGETAEASRIVEEALADKTEEAHFLVVRAL
jgi:arylsulfatase A-like enzyme